MKCYICWDQDKNVEATAVCNELNKPVCVQHAFWCVQEGHGTKPMEER